MARSCGVLLHITSLPSHYGVGDLGDEAYRFADFLAAAGINVWQVLPPNPISKAHSFSPYRSDSAFALNPLFISLERMVSDGLLDRSDLPEALPVGDADYEQALTLKTKAIDRAFEHFRHAGGSPILEQYCRDQQAWLDDYVSFRALDAHFGGSWRSWPAEPDALLRSELAERVEREEFVQFVLDRQWSDLKRYCHGLGIRMMGDIPIYVDHHSADVWSNPEIFKLGPDRLPAFVSGVPPDAFSATGQLWGMPVYDWSALRQQAYGWWENRFARSFELFDVVRIDHFRGFVAFWQVAADRTTAEVGQWVDVPARDFFTSLERRFGTMPIIAEDLGFITPDVREVMREFGFAGTRVLIFGFCDNCDSNPHKPHSLPRDCALYTGTHDMNPVRGWFERETTTVERTRLNSYLGREATADSIAADMVRMAVSSVADMIILPMQDILGLGSESRMNLPGTAWPNWVWRLRPASVDSNLATGLRGLLRGYGRVGPEEERRNSYVRPRMRTGRRNRA
jgi:4-alpha-glucanotransferase